MKKEQNRTVEKEMNRNEYHTLETRRQLKIVKQF